MFWLLFLAHLLGDYVFQPDWLVANKHRRWALALHATIHFLLMFILVGQARYFLLPQIAALTIAHVLIDAMKLYFASKRPDAGRSAYLIDQALHILFTAIIAYWIEGSLPSNLASEPSTWPAIACGYILATYAWATTERLLSVNEKQYNHEVILQTWPRMISRAGLLTVWLVLAQSYSGITLLFVANLPYLSGKYRLRALLTDVAVTLVTAAIVLLANA
jgi:hypothetical protein